MDYKRVAFKMYLKEGQREVYKKRHDEIWPELKQLLAESGIKEYSIFLDEETSTLFAFQKVSGNGGSQDLADHPIVKNGGSIWRILWKRTLIIRRFHLVWRKFFIWNDGKI